MSYTGKSLAEIKADMEAKYRDGTAYNKLLPWDADRMHRIHRMFLVIAAPAMLE